MGGPRLEATNKRRLSEDEARIQRGFASTVASSLTSRHLSERLAFNQQLAKGVAFTLRRLNEGPLRAFGTESCGYACIARHLAEDERYLSVHGVKAPGAYYRRLSESEGENMRWRVAEGVASMINRHLSEDEEEAEF